jgi:hypothetical protein
VGFFSGRHLSRETLAFRLAGGTAGFLSLVVPLLFPLALRLPGRAARFLPAAVMLSLALVVVFRIVVSHSKNNR